MLIASVEYPEHLNVLLTKVSAIARQYNWSCKVHCVDRVKTRRKDEFVVSFYTPGVFIQNATQEKMIKNIVEALKDDEQFRGFCNPVFLKSKGDWRKGHKDYHRLQLSGK